MNARQLALRALLVSVSTALALCAAEALGRFALPVGDYLMPSITTNEVLGVRVRPGTAGVDEWGFRNSLVPSRVDVVAIGDSLTYGYSARRTDSWPSQLARLSGRSVYNLGMGGWGPYQYHCALNTFGLRLAPATVVIGLFLGNDVQETAGPAGSSCDGLDPAAIARRDREPPRTDPDDRVLDAPREWLAHHSILYQAVKLGAPQMVRSVSPTLVVSDRYVVREVRGHKAVLRTEGWLSHHPDLVQPALANVVAVFGAIRRVARAHRINCVVVLIPSREAVYGAVVHDAPGVTAEMRAEVAVADRLRSALGRDFLVVEPIPALRRAVLDGTMIAPASEDIHLNADGYGVLAREIAAALGGLSSQRNPL